MNAHERDSLERKFWGCLILIRPLRQMGRVEHYARVWEANLCYTDPKNDRIGWRTDMGETLIRLGRPDEKVRKRLGGSMVDTSPIWFWQYRSVAYPCTLAFVDQTNSAITPFPFRTATGQLPLQCKQRGCLYQLSAQTRRIDACSRAFACRDDD